MAVPLDFLKPQETPVAAPKQDEAPDFLNEMTQLFSRFISMHDRTLSQLRTIRRNHQELITSYQSTLMELIGGDVSIVQSFADEFRFDMGNAIMAGEGPTPCLNDIQSRFERKVRDVNEAIRGCATYANDSMSNHIDTIFYPVFNTVQQEHSLYPFYALVALSRANIMTDQDQILSYMRTLFELKERAWLENVVVLFEWEDRHFQVLSDFMVEEVNMCSQTESVIFMADVMSLIHEISACPVSPPWPPAETTTGEPAPETTTTTEEPTLTTTTEQSTPVETTTEVLPTEETTTL